MTASQKLRRSQTTGHPVVVRLQSVLLKELDKMRKDEVDLPTRPEMLRRLLIHHVGKPK